MEKELEITTDADIDKAKDLILYNDNVNTFEHVILCLMGILGYPMSQAEQLAIIADGKGSVAVTSGKVYELIIYKEELTAAGLKVEIK